MKDFETLRNMMVDTQVRPSDVTNFAVVEAMLAVPREDYLPDDKRDVAYAGENIEIGGCRVVLEPRTFAKMLDAVDIEATDLVLDIGCALGYSAAVCARLGEAVVAVEEDAELARAAEAALADHGVDNVAVVEAPLAAGAPKHAPYDVILIEGGVEVVPDVLLDQLREGGRIAALFEDGALGTCMVGHKVDGTVTWRYAFNAAAPVLPGFEKPRGFVF